MWQDYKDRIEAIGGTQYNTSLKREADYISRKIVNNLSYHSADIYDQANGWNTIYHDMNGDVIHQKVAIINSDNLNEKYIYSLPGEDIELGSLIHWMDNYWLVTERDANTTIYTRAKLLQCNYLLKWVDEKSGTVCEQWCVIEDGTKLKRVA